MNPAPISLPAAKPAGKGAPGAASPAAAPGRVASVDGYRGLVMFLMMGELLNLSRISRALPQSDFWGFLAFHQSHVEWTGCSLHDLIQPSFSFLVGVALPFSIASRMAKGQTFGVMLGHAVWRSLLLIFLGVFLRSIGRSQTYYTFEDTLSQIGLGYTFLFLLGFRSVKTQWAALALILFGYWLAFALYPLPGPGFDYSAAGVAADWPHHAQGFAAHWNKNTNLAWAFDNWFLNLFPREKPFQFNGGGYSTLSFIPTLGTMIFGLIAGGWLKAGLSAPDRMKRFVVAGLSCLAIGWLLHALGICPNVKKIWTPTWTIFSAGWCFLFLAAFYAVMDWRGCRAWAFPLMVVGANSIAAYCMDHLFSGFFRSALNTHLGEGFFNAFGEAYARSVQGAFILAIFWLILFWMYRRKIFLKI